MRCLLINPYCPITEGPTPPLGISFLAAALENAGFETKILDFSVFPYSKEYLRRFIAKFDPTIVGVTSVTMTFNHAIKIVKDAKEIKKQVFTIMGGPHVSFCTEQTLKDHEALDAIAIGEGEQTIVDFANSCEDKSSWENINGLAYREGNSVVVTAKREYLDVNTLPLPARHLLPLGRYRALHTPISITTSRGCPFKCIFCVGRQMVGSRVRYRDPLSVVEELELLSKLNFPQINISDDLFTAKKSHCIAICDGIIKRNLNIQWSSFARVDTVSPILLEAMKAAGCKTISFGVETANSDILKTIKKGITLEKVEKAVSMCNEIGIQPHISFILGLPGESKQTLKETQHFGHRLEELGGMYGYHLLAPFPGTAVRDNNEDYDLTILTDDWDQYHANRAIVETEGVKKETLDDIAVEWDSETHKLLAEIKEKIEQGTATEEEAWQITNLERFLFLYQLMMEEILEKSEEFQLKESESLETAALKHLASNIYKKMKLSEEQTFEILSYAYHRDSFTLDNQEGNLKWGWRNFL